MMSSVPEVLAPMSTGSESRSVEKVFATEGIGASGESKDDDAPLRLAVLVPLLQAACVKNKGKKLKLCEDVKELMSRLDASDPELKRYMIFNPERHYTRNLISTDDDTYTLMALCWNAGKESPIHDHPCDGCFMRVTQGAITETRYELDEATNRLVETFKDTYKEGVTGYMHDDLGLHKVGNTSLTPAVSIHLYSPPYETCRVWMDKECADKICRPTCQYYSEGGEVV